MLLSKELPSQDNMSDAGDINNNTIAVKAIYLESDIKLLDDIDTLRSCGISHHISLPQIVVCGDQSSGKSSVLEAISGVPFPTKDNLCTRFATEVILRRTPTRNVSVSISPGPNREPSDFERLEEFNETLTDLGQFGAILDRAKSAMGLAGSSSALGGGSAFGDDVLRVEISGPDRPQLTIVDLPGLIHSENKSQTSTDVALVKDLVGRYMHNRRSVILAIVSAKNDYANQIVLKMAREVDPHGLRTLGIITKPDTLDVGSDNESAFFALAKNEDIHFKLGWHVLRNRDYENRDCSSKYRDELERSFLSDGIWKDLPRSATGIESLRNRLSKVLLQQIKAELPSLVQEIEKGMSESQHELQKLGERRVTLDEQRRYLLRIGQRFQSITKAAVDGVYGDPFFGDPISSEGYSKRLRAVVQNYNLNFAEAMRKRGHQHDIYNHSDESSKERPSTPEPLPSFSSPPYRISRAKFLKRTKRLLERSRGRELPGTFSPLLIGDLFYEQSRPWRALANAHLDSVWNAAQSFLSLVVEGLAQEETAEVFGREIIGPMMEELLKEMRTCAESTLDVYENGHPITYNHYFIETVQKVRALRDEDELRKRLGRFCQDRGVKTLEELHVTRISGSTLISALSKPNEVDMDRHACSEAVDCMLAFYKVALKMVVDNVTAHAIEKVLIQALPDLLSPEIIIQMEPSTVQAIAQESHDSAERRETLSKKISSLERGLDTCRRHAIRPKPEPTHRPLIQVNAKRDEDFPSPTMESAPETNGEIEDADTVPDLMKSGTELQEVPELLPEPEGHWKDMTLGLGSAKRKAKKRPKSTPVVCE